MFRKHNKIIEHLKAMRLTMTSGLNGGLFTLVLVILAQSDL
jgi:hypothetical protein